jgi:hypothetical protein
MRFLLLTIAVAVILLIVDVPPGLLASTLICPCIASALLAVALVSWSAMGLCAVLDRSLSRRNRRCVYLAGGVAVLTAMFWLGDVSTRVALWFVEDEFKSLLATAPNDYGDEPLGRWIGCFYVDRYGADESGGVFFRTASHADGIGPDTMSYGIAYRPHQYSCPFGDSRYY